MLGPFTSSSTPRGSASVSAEASPTVRRSRAGTGVRLPDQLNDQRLRPPPLYPAGAEATWSLPGQPRGRTQRCGGARGAWAVFGVIRRNALDIVTGDEPAPAQQVEGGRVGVREQCGERQLAPCSAELLRGLDGGVGLHCGTGHRGVPGRGRDRGRAGRAAAHGAVGGGRAIGRATGGSGTPRTRTGPGVHAFVASLPGRPASSSLSTNQC